MNPLKKLLHAVSSAPGPAPMPVDIPPQWLQAISPEHPSGAHLEYDTEYTVLAARLSAKPDVQYGEFSAAAPEPDWKEIERDCRRLLLRTKDINILVWFTRSRTRQAGALGLLQGLYALQQICTGFAASVHPPLQLDGEDEPMVQANALAALCDPLGLLEDVRQITVAASTAMRLSVRDVERALAVPRPPYGPTPEALRLQLADLQARQDPPLLALQACADCVQQLQAWANTQLGDFAPTLKPLLRLLQPLCLQTPATAEQPVEHLQAEALPDAHPAGHTDARFHTHTATASAPPDVLTLQPPYASNQALHALQAHPGHAPHSAPPADIATQREQVRESLAQVRQWIELHEPSSPVAVLLKQCERMWGKRFSEVAHIIPPDLLQAWDKDQ
jgi:type VI secretion system protein ImpA